MWSAEPHGQGCVCQSLGVSHIRGLSLGLQSALGDVGQVERVMQTLMPALPLHGTLTPGVTLRYAKPESLSRRIFWSGQRRLEAQEPMGSTGLPHPPRPNLLPVASSSLPLLGCWLICC